MVEAAVDDVHCSLEGFFSGFRYCYFPFMLELMGPPDSQSRPCNSLSLSIVSILRWANPGWYCYCTYSILLSSHVRTSGKRSEAHRHFLKSSNVLNVSKSRIQNHIGVSTIIDFFIDFLFGLSWKNTMRFQIEELVPRQWYWSHLVIYNTFPPHQKTKP